MTKNRGAQSRFLKPLDLGAWSFFGIWVLGNWTLALLVRDHLRAIDVLVLRLAFPIVIHLLLVRHLFNLGGCNLDTEAYCHARWTKLYVKIPWWPLVTARASSSRSMLLIGRDLRHRGRQVVELAVLFREAYLSMLVPIQTTPVTVHNLLKVSPIALCFALCFTMQALFSIHP